MTETITFRLYDTARHMSLKRSDVFIKGNGEVYYNDGTAKFPIWVLRENGEDLQIRDIKIMEGKYAND
jgi:hypothetical protein